LDFVFRSVVKRVVHNRCLFLERILGVHGVGTPSGKTAANNGGDDNTNKNTSTDSSGDGSGAGEKVGASLNVVAARLVCAFELVTTLSCSGIVVSFVCATRFTEDSIGFGGFSIFVELTRLPVLANFGFVFATSSGIASVNCTSVTIITVNWSGCASSIDANVICACVEIIANNWNNFTS